VGKSVRTITLLGVGIGLLLLLSFVPLFNLYALSLTLDTPWVGVEARTAETVSMFNTYWHGKAVLVVSLIVALFAVLTLVLFLTAAPDVSDPLITLCKCFSIGWTVTVVLWSMGCYWKVITEVGSLTKAVRGMWSGGVSIRVYPDAGLWITLILAIGLLVVFSLLKSPRERRLWTYFGYWAGGALGLLVVILFVQPWRPTVEVNIRSPLWAPSRPDLLRPNPAQSAGEKKKD
jgi:hypothetical protein